MSADRTTHAPAGERGAHGGVTPGHYYGHGLPNLPLDNYPG